MAEYLYSDYVKGIIDGMSPNTNVLEQYDNVTYNISLYMYDFQTQQEIDNALQDHSFNADNYVSKRKIIAQTGLTVNFVLNSLTMKSTYGNINSKMNVATYAINIKLFEPMGANFTNAVDIISEMLGYKSHLFRPYWIDIWFSGYDSTTGEPVEKIKFENGMNTITLEGVMGNVKSQIDSSGTVWNIEFTPNYSSLLNKDNNHLTITAPMKANTNGKFSDILKRCIETMKDDYVSQFMEPYRKEAEAKIGNEYIKLNIKMDDNSKFDDDVEILANTSNDDTKNETIEVKPAPKQYFTTFIQDLLSRVKGDKYKNCVARFDIRPVLKDFVSDVPIFNYVMNIVLYEDPLIEKYNNNINSDAKELLSNSEDAVKKYADKSLDDGSLRKKYVFGFSGIDTSVLQIYNNYDMLWYMNDVSDSIIKYRDANINLMRSSNSDNKIKSVKNEDHNKNKNDEMLSISNLVEDIFYDNYEEIISKGIYSRVPVLSGNLNQTDQRIMVSSTSKEEDALAIASKTLFERYYKSGQISTTKFEILGDPYWISINDNRNYNDKDIPMNIANYKCAFQLRTFYQQVTNYNEYPADYKMNDSLNVTGIYLIYECESKFEDGKFTQKLSGVFDPHFLAI